MASIIGFSVLHSLFSVRFFLILLQWHQSADLDRQCIDFFLILRSIWEKINALTYIALSHISSALHCIALIFHKNINVKSMYISVKLPLLTIVYIYIVLKLTLKSIHWTYFERKINASHCIDLLIQYITLPCFALKLFRGHNTLPCLVLIKKRPHRHTLWQPVLNFQMFIFQPFEELQGWNRI